MATINRAIRYRCSNDCEMSGCPGHVALLEYQSTSDYITFTANGTQVGFERGQLDAFLDLLMMLDRVDSVSPRVIKR